MRRREDAVRDYFESTDQVAKFGAQDDYNLLSRRRAVAELLDRLEFDEVLDLGCGSGGYLPLVSAHDCEYHGCDFSESMIDAARERAVDIGVADRTSFEVADAADTPYPDDRFDVVFSVGLLEYFEDPDDLLREISRILRPGGGLVLHSYSPYPYLNHMWPLLGRVKRLIGDGVAHHRRPKHEVDDIAARHGFELVDWRHSNVNVLPVPLNFVLGGLQERLSEFLVERNPRNYGYFAVNYIGTYRNEQ